MSQHQFVICIDNSEYEASLELRKIYEVILDDAARKLDRVRVVDESGDDYLFPSACFMPIELPRMVEEAVLRLE